MCGIFGYIGNIHEQIAARCLHTLTHRGPDGYGLWHQDNITLGHRRLSILDLSESGRQPMSYANGRYWITFNGEIYNFIEIRSELKKKGYTFESDSDTEVILAAYIEWGPDCCLKFNGMWAFAIWDDVEKRLFLSRDRFGKKPLFYAFLRNNFAFASEMKAIYPLLDEVKLSRDFEWMRSNIFLYEATDKCLIDGIKRFPAGHSGVFKDGKLSVQRYWNTLDHLVEVPARYEEQVELFREVFIDACRIRMRSDVPIGTSLSGGLDSSAVISVMAHIAKTQDGERVNRDWQHAFIASLPGSPLDESRYAQRVVDHLGVAATFIEVDPLKEIDKLEHYFYQFEELYTTSPIPMIQVYREMKQHGVSVTLDGHGADELFAGYGNLLFEACLDTDIGINELANLYRDLFIKETTQFKVIKNNVLLYVYFVLRKMAKKALGRNVTSIDAQHKNFHKLDVFNRYLYVLTHETILPTLLRNYDRYAMINGVEIRMPFMDHRLVTYSMSLPMRSKIRDGFTKKIVRDALGRFMPDDIAYRKTKVGFSSPIVDWMQNQLRDYFLEHINSNRFRNCRLINPVKVKKQIERVINNKNISFNYAQRAWENFMPFIWEKAILDRDYTHD